MANLKLKNPSGGSLALVSADGASDLTVTFPATTGTAMVSGNMPAFSAYLNANQTGVASTTFTKVTFPTEQFDTNNNFASSTFTPTVAGYYQINATVNMFGSAAAITRMIISIYVNGAEFIRGYDNGATQQNGIGSSGTVSSVIYLNGTTDYVDIYGWGAVVSGTVTFGGSTSISTNFNGCLLRTA